MYSAYSAKPFNYQKSLEDQRQSLRIEKNPDQD